MADYVVGDLHGCLEPLQRLLGSIRFQPGKDRLFCTGDLVNRGPDSVGVLRLLHAMGAESVLGNHDLRLLLQCQTEENADGVRDLLQQPDGGALVRWLAARPASICGPLPKKDGTASSWLLIHAGVHPDWTLEDIASLTEEIAVWMDRDRTRLLRIALDCAPVWERGLSGIERAGTALALMSRLRHLHADGRADFSRPAEGLWGPTMGWFQHRLKLWNDGCGLLLFGHWAALEGKTLNSRVLALDTGAVWGKELTAVRLDDLRYFRVSGWRAG